MNRSDQSDGLKAEKKESENMKSFQDGRSYRMTVLRGQRVVGFRI